MLNRVRQFFDPFILKLGAIASQSGLPPTLFTIFGLVAAITSGLVYSRGDFYGQVLGGILLLLSGLMDVIDGAVARVTNSISSLGSFLDSTLDRLGEIFVFLGILVGGYALSWIVLLALTLSLMVSYVRARGESLGVKVKGVGVAERAERIVVLSILSILGFTFIGVYLILALSVISLAQRVYHISKKLKG